MNPCFIPGSLHTDLPAQQWLQHMLCKPESRNALKVFSVYAIGHLHNFCRNLLRMHTVVSAAFFSAVTSYTCKINTPMMTFNLYMQKVSHLLRIFNKARNVYLTSNGHHCEYVSARAANYVTSTWLLQRWLTVYSVMQFPRAQPTFSVRLFLLHWSSFVLTLFIIPPSAAEKVTPTICGQSTFLADISSVNFCSVNNRTVLHLSLKYAKSSQFVFLVLAFIFTALSY